MKGMPFMNFCARSSCDSLQGNPHRIWRFQALSLKLCELKLVGIACALNVCLLPSRVLRDRQASLPPFCLSDAGVRQPPITTGGQSWETSHAAFTPYSSRVESPEILRSHLTV